MIQVWGVINVAKVPVNGKDGRGGSDEAWGDEGCRSRDHEEGKKVGGFAKRAGYVCGMRGCDGSSWN